MSTRSTVSIMYEGGNMKTIYCHFDGNLEDLGQDLLHYDTTEKVHELMLEGDASYIDSTLDDSRFYSRDFGETDTHAVSYCSLDDFFENCMLLDYNYIFDSATGTWLYFRNLNENFLTEVPNMKSSANA